MITAMRYLPMLLASTVLMASLMFQLFVTDITVSTVFRDITLFMILYYVVRRLTIYIEKILKNYWKIL